MVTPEYYGGNPAATIAQALHDREMLKYSRDKDAYETGFGATPVDPNAPPPQQGMFARALGGILSKVTGHSSDQPPVQQPVTQQFATALSGQTTSPSQTPSQVPPPTPFNPQGTVPKIGGATPVTSATQTSTSGGSVSSGTPTAPGSFNASTGSFMPSMPAMMRLPSGALVPTISTPFGMSRYMAQMKAQEMAENFRKTDSEIGLNNANAFKSNREGSRLQLGDDGYAGAMGQVAGQEAMAKLPTELRLAVAKGQIDLHTALASIGARGQVEQGLQRGQQTFTGTQNQLNRDQTERILGERQQGDLSNRLSEIGATQSGQIIPTLMRGTASIWNGTRREFGLQPSTGGWPPPVTPPTTVLPNTRAARTKATTPPIDPALKQYIK